MDETQIRQVIDEAKSHLKNLPADKFSNATGRQLYLCVNELERLYKAVVYGARLVDEINDVDLHYEAYATYCERHGGRDDGEDPSDDDYAEAFVRIVQ